MPLVHKSLRHNVVMLAAIFLLVIGGAWLAVRITTSHLLYNSASSAARQWAQYVAGSVTDLEQIAAGEVPSEASMSFFRAALKAQRVFRYEIYNRHGYSLLLSDRERIGLVDISTFSPEALRAIKTGEPVVTINDAATKGFPAFYALAYVPVFAEERPMAVVAAYVDQAEERNQYHSAFLIAAAALCGLTALGFAIPAIAWYRRSEEKLRGDRRIRYLAHHDVLTGLMNRSRVIERLSVVLAHGGPDASIALHYIDLDRFKAINDALGHDSGDVLLKVIAGRLKDAVRRGDDVARLGGDEFVIIQSDVKGREDAQAFAERVAAALSPPVQVGEQEILPTISIGIALAPADGQTPERLLKSADLALYSSKAGGRDCIRFFSPEMDAAMLERLQLERTIREAASKEAFELYYQPVFGVAGRELSGFEALLRLRGPDGQPIPPAVFIPVAEEIRLIDRIGAWVLRQACRDAALWPKHLTVAVNLSPAQFSSGSISTTVADALRESGLEAHRLELEITESLLLGDTDTIMRELKALKRSGVAIVMDDFGTGYSSLSYLWRFPFDKIKIDRSFMAGFGDGDRDASTVVKTIIALGRELNMRVTVEGVETEEQVAFLDESHADLVQGFYFGRPMPAVDVAPAILRPLHNMQASERYRIPAAEQVA